MPTIDELKNQFIDMGILLFEGDYSHNTSAEITLNGENNLKDYVDYLQLININYSFYFAFVVTEESFIDLKLITEYEFGDLYKRFKVEAKDYNKRVKNHLGHIISAVFFIHHNGLFFNMEIQGNVDQDICEDGSEALEMITMDYYDALKLHQEDREHELLLEIEEMKEEDKRIKQEKFYSLLKSDEYFKELPNKESRVKRAVDLAYSIGLRETKSDISAMVDIFLLQLKKLGSKTF